ncbi:hypothetical protein GAY33_19070 [Azospirillum brasilense]|uniref:hypothetical protein n=1 Tax=Azospirillum argentinense TaxID=2970906 RepID=UPI00190E9363|nr:hypothetical protein [Azospirillum argentinense]MBK3801298.1 hypothetical protein [Azospirillum argentinense]
MFMRYQSDHANQVHQLLVSVSKHFYVRRNGTIAFQWKAIDIDLARIQTAKRNHVVHYLLRDHYSGAFYAEVTTSDRLIDLGEFLYRAWAEKETGPGEDAPYLFRGMPDALTVPAKVMERFPGVARIMEACGIAYIKATSGFQAGVRDLKTWEEEFRYRFWRIDEPVGFEVAQSMAPACACLMSGDRYNGRSKIREWTAGNPSIRLPPDRERFLAVYAG